MASSTNSASSAIASARLWRALEADRRGGLEVDPGAAAERAAEVARPDLDLVVERQQPLVQRAEHLGGTLAGLDRQVGAGDVADEQRVAGEQRPGRAAAAGVAEQEGRCARAGARGCGSPRSHLAQLQRPAVGEALVRVLGLGQLVDVDRRAGRAAPAARDPRRGRRGCGSRARARSGPRAGGPAAGRARSPTAGRPPPRRPRRGRRPGRRRSRDPRG